MSNATVPGRWAATNALSIKIPPTVRFGDETAVIVPVNQTDKRSTFYSPGRTFDMPSWFLPGPVACQAQCKALGPWAQRQEPQTDFFFLALPGEYETWSVNYWKFEWNWKLTRCRRFPGSEKNNKKNKTKHTRMPVPAWIVPNRPPWPTRRSAGASTTSHSFSSEKDKVSKQVPHFSNVKKAFSPKVLELKQLRYHVKTTHERCGPFSLVVLSQRRGRVTTSSGPTLSETLSNKTLQVS